MEKEVKRRRRYFSKVQKMEILKAFDRGVTCTSLAERHRISPVLIYRWRKSMAKQEGALNHSKDSKEILSELEEAKKKNECLQRALSDSVIENQILKKALEVLKKSIRLKRFGSQKK